MGALSTFRNLAGGRLPPLTRTKALADVQAFFDPSYASEPVDAG